MPSPFKIPFLDGDPQDEQQPVAAPVDPNAIPPLDMGMGQGLPDLGAAPAGPRVVSQSQATRENRIGQIDERLGELNKPHLGQEGSSLPGTGGKILHGLATAGNILGDIFAPNVMARVPGTQMHNDAEKASLQKEENALNTVGEKEAENRQETNAKANYQGAEARHLDQQTADLTHPKPIAPEIHDTPMGLMAIDKQNATATPVRADGTPIGPKLETSVVPNIISPLDGRPHTFLVDKQGKKVADLGEHYERPITVNTGAKESHQGKAEALKLYTPAMDSAERFNVMSQNYEDAVKNHDQQAMLSLLANHLGMTMGLQKGARMTKDIIHEAEQSRPWLQGMQAKFDSNGYLSGVNLTPPQMRQMVDLGASRFREDISKARSGSQYMGVQDDGPTRIPSKATVRFYLGKAGGDVAKAKALAAEEGWTVNNAQ